MTDVFVGNLDITLTEPQLRDLFAAYGAVETVSLVMNDVNVKFGKLLLDGFPAI